jgi:hypothetical protein
MSDRSNCAIAAMIVNGLPERRTRVDRLAEAHELNAEVPEEVEALDEVADAAPEAVERGDDHHVHLAGLHGREEPVEAGAAILRPRHAVVEVLGRLPAAGRHVLAEIAELRLARLVGCRDAGVDGDPLPLALTALLLSLHGVLLDRIDSTPGARDGTAPDTCLCRPHDRHHIACCQARRAQGRRRRYR